jgi:hypothetical protein
MLSPVTQRQFERVKTRYPGASLEELSSGAALVTVPDFPLPAGWSAASTDIRFLAPVGYPGPNPDCFWATSGLRLASGAMPQNAADPNPIPETPHQALWFSWHIEDPARNWRPARDDLMTYLSMIGRRFEQRQ